MGERSTQLGHCLEAFRPGVQSFDVRFAQPERGELGGHLFATCVRCAQARPDVSAAERDGPENPELHQYWRVENRDLVHNRHREVEHVTEHRNEQHAGRRQQQGADRDYQDVQRRKLRRRAGLCDVHDRGDQEQVEESLEVKEAVAGGVLPARGIQDRPAGEKQGRYEGERRHQCRAAVGSPPNRDGGNEDRRRQRQPAQVEDSKNPLPPSAARGGER